MNYRIAQEQSYLGNDMWHWRVWVEAPQIEMDQIQEVIWFLHHAFPDPVIHTKDWVSHFAIERTGCCVFRILAELHLADDSLIPHIHWLELDYPDEEEDMPPPGEER